MRSVSIPNNQDIEKKKYVIEYDLPGKMVFEGDGKPADAEVIAQLTEKFKSGKYRIIDLYIVYSTMDETNYYHDSEANGSTVMILQADFMQSIYPDYLDFMDYITDKTLEVLQSGSLYVECCFKMKETDADVYMLSMREVKIPG